MENKREVGSRINDPNTIIEQLKPRKASSHLNNVKHNIILCVSMTCHLVSGLNAMSQLFAGVFQIIKIGPNSALTKSFRSSLLSHDLNYG